MMTALKALLERATKRPWKVNGQTNGKTEGAWIYTPAYDVAKDMIREDADLAAIAVNHIEALVAFVTDEVAGAGNHFAVCECKWCEATKLLARIEAAAKGFYDV